MQQNMDIMEHFARLSRMVRRRPGEHRRISRGGHRLIGAVLQNEGIRTSELAEKMDIRPASLTDVLKRMEQEGFVRREKDAGDSRVSHVYTTPKAAEEYACWQAERAKQGERLKACLTEQEALTFCEICEKLCLFLEKEYPPEPRPGPCQNRNDGKEPV